MDQQIKQYNQQLDAIYAPQEQQLRAEYQASLPQFAAEEASLKQAKKNAFRDIGDIAGRRNMFFSGFQPAEQARYIGEKYLPALAGVAQQRSQGKRDLLSALTGLKTDRRSRVLDYREQLRQEALERRRLQEEREFTARQNQLDRATTRGSSSYSGGGGGGGDVVDPGVEFLNEIKRQMEASPYSSRQAQDAWANAWFEEKGVSKDNRQGYWNLFNKTFGRPDNPYSDPFYQR